MKRFFVFLLKMSRLIVSTFQVWSFWNERKGRKALETGVCELTIFHFTWLNDCKTCCWFSVTDSVVWIFGWRPYWKENMMLLGPFMCVWGRDDSCLVVLVLITHVAGVFDPRLKNSVPNTAVSSCSTHIFLCVFSLSVSHCFLCFVSRLRLASHIPLGIWSPYPV